MEKSRILKAFPISPPYLRAKKSVLEEFDRFHSRIELTGVEKTAISISHNNIRDILKNSTEIKVIDSFLTGSYARQTMIRPLKDVDFFVKMHYGEHKNDKPVVLLSKIRKILSKANPKTPISVSPPCVRVKFGYCHFEVVPAFGIEDNEDLFEIPTERGGDWQPTFPKIPDKWMTEQNKKSEGLFIPTIKMLKRWRDIRCSFLRSFHLEMLTRMAFDYYMIDNYAEGVYAFFEISYKLFEIYKKTPFIKEPGRDGVYVDQYLYDEPSKLLNVRVKTKRYLSLANKAFNYMKKGQIGAAKNIWRRILGPDYHITP